MGQTFSCESANCNIHGGEECKPSLLSISGREFPDPFEVKAPILVTMHPIKQGLPEKQSRKIK